MIKRCYNYVVHFLLLSLIISSCAGNNNEEEEIHANLIPQSKFAAILAECQLAESQTTVTRVLQPIYKDSILNYYAGIFEANNITSKDFYFSLKHYSKDPDLLDSIYSESIGILKKKSDELGEIEIPIKKLNAISRHQLGDIINQTPYADTFINDSVDLQIFRNSLMTYIDSNFYLLDSIHVNRDSFEFSFVINTSTKIMYNQLRDYLVSKKNLEVK